MKRFKYGEIVRYRPLECNGRVVNKSLGVLRPSITIKLSQPNVEGLDKVEVFAPFTLVEHLSEPYHK